jgi:hypothetical protein
LVFAVVVDLIVVAVAMHVLCDVALACCWVGVSEHKGWCPEVVVYLPRVLVMWHEWEGGANG